MGKQSSDPGSLRRQQTDGRVERGNRTRRTIVEAHAALLREGSLRPTAARIAERAGVSVRTLWSSFGDMEGLLNATTDYWLLEDDELRVAIDPTLTLAERIALFCDERLRRLENISPAARAAVIMEHASEALRASRLRHVRRVVDDVEAVFATELAAAPDPDGLRDALVGVTSWNTWSFLRDDLERTALQARAAMAHTLTALLT